MVIDEKGRLFGKFNVIDLAVVLIVFAMVPMFIIGGKIMGAKRVESEVKHETLTVAVKFTKIIPELAGVMKEGDIEKGENNKPIGKLIKIISNEPQKLLAIDVNMSGDKLGLATDMSYREIKALFELDCVIEKRAPVYHGYVVKIGNSLIFSTDLYSLQGTITEIRK
jgi:hypothetical protein